MIKTQTNGKNNKDMQMYFRLLFSLILVCQLGFSQPLNIASRLNKAKDHDEESVPDPKPKALGSAEGYASADTITASIGCSMLKFGSAFGISAAVIILIFSQNQEQGGGGGGHQHQHQHQHSHQ